MNITQQLPVKALNTVADSLPGLGIVAAVLGVVVTMGSLGGPPEEIGHKVAAALVGTFLGILLCYGLLGPDGLQDGQSRRGRASLLSHRPRGAELVPERQPASRSDRIRPARGPGHVRPSFQELEKAYRGKP